MGGMIPTVLYVALGGALGAALRYGVALMVAFPLGTLAVNVAGSFLIGVAFTLLAADKGLGGWQPLIITGILGGFTTFSAFSLDTMRLIADGRISAAMIYAAASVLLSLGACALGLWLTKGMTV